MRRGPAPAADPFEEFFAGHTEKRLAGGGVRCLLCGKETLVMGNMKQHFEVHHFKRDLHCDHCGRPFKTRNSLCVHRKHCNVVRV